MKVCIKNLGFPLQILSVICLILLTGIVNAQDPAKGTNPNVIIINADDLDYGDMRAYEKTKVNTPT